MSFIDFNSLLIGTVFGLLIWTVFQGLRLLIKRRDKLPQDRPKMSNHPQDDNFLEIPLEEIFVPDPTGKKRSLLSFVRKVNSLRDRNPFYRDKSFRIGQEFRDYTDFL